MKAIVERGTKTFVTVKRPDGDAAIFEFDDVFSLDVQHHIDTREVPNSFRDAISHDGTTLTITGRLAGAPKTHLHQWKPDGFGTVAHEHGIAHEGLMCECGARACGNLKPKAEDESCPASIVHNIREATNPA